MDIIFEEPPKHIFEHADSLGITPDTSTVYSFTCGIDEIRERFPSSDWELWAETEYGSWRINAVRLNEKERLVVLYCMDDDSHPWMNYQDIYMLLDNTNLDKYDVVVANDVEKGYYGFTEAHFNFDWKYAILRAYNEI